MIVKWNQNQNDQTERKKETEKRMREERLVSASLLSFFFGKVGSTDTFIINKAEFKMLHIINNIVLKIGMFGGVGPCFDWLFDFFFFMHIYVYRIRLIIVKCIPL